jgi:hypothetical protein
MGLCQVGERGRREKKGIFGIKRKNDETEK